jgi:hypothetical protein
MVSVSAKKFKIKISCLCTFKSVKGTNREGKIIGDVVILVKRLSKNSKKGGLGLGWEGGGVLPGFS